MHKKTLLTMFFSLVFLFSNSTIYGYWQQKNIENQIHKINTNTISVGFYNNSFCYKPNQHTLIINNCFKQKYMQRINQTDFDWKRDEYNNIINRSVIKSLTPKNTIIYLNNTRFLVLSDNYNLIDHNFPNLQQPLSWALFPIVLQHVKNWAYRKNHVVLATDNSYYMAKHYTTDNPIINRTSWNKIEPVGDENFAIIESTNLADYRNPILSTIKRAYLYDNFNTYLVGDVVFYNNQKWVAVSDSTGVLPTVNNSWAWVNIGL